MIEELANWVKLSGHFYCVGAYIASVTLLILAAGVLFGSAMDQKLKNKINKGVY